MFGEHNNEFGEATDSSRESTPERLSTQDQTRYFLNPLLCVDYASVSFVEMAGGLPVALRVPDMRSAAEKYGVSDPRCTNKL